MKFHEISFHEISLQNFQSKHIGDTLKVHFFGVAENNWNLGVHGIGIKRGMTGKGEFSFFDIISLNIDSKFSFSTAGSFADFILETYLDLSGEQMVGNQLKVTKLEGVLPGRAPPTEMVGFSQPILVSYAAGGAAKVELTLYVRTPVLYGARARATRERWALFQERAAQVVPTKISKTAWANFVGPGRGTIDDALDGKGLPGPRATLDRIELLMRTHFDSDFAEFAVALAAAQLKAKGKGKRAVESLATGARVPWAGLPASRPDWLRCLLRASPHCLCRAAMFCLTYPPSWCVRAVVRARRRGHAAQAALQHPTPRQILHRRASCAVPRGP